MMGRASWMTTELGESFEAPRSSAPRTPPTRERAAIPKMYIIHTKRNVVYLRMSNLLVSRA